MRNVPVARVDALGEAILAIGTDYPAQHRLAPHEHRRAQVLYAATGVMRVDTSDGSWTIPTERAVLIPPRTQHAVEMRGVSTRSLYLEPAAVPWWPRQCLAVEVTPLLRELLLAAVDVPEAGTGAPDRRSTALHALLLEELRALSPLPLGLPLPGPGPLRERCLAFQEAPTIRTTPETWAAALGVSTRTLGRRFTAETGLGFAQWRERAVALHAVLRLGEGLPVARVSGNLGYDSPAAFAQMFRRVLGQSPRAFLPRASLSQNAPEPAAPPGRP